MNFEKLKNYVPVLKNVQVNGNKFSRNWLLKTAVRRAQEEVWPVLNAIGRERIEWLIESEKSLLEFLPAEKVPDTWKLWLGQAHQYKRYLNVFSTDDFRGLLPEWLADMTREGRGRAWLEALVNEIKEGINARSTVKGPEKGTDPHRPS